MAKSLKPGIKAAVAAVFAGTLLTLSACSGGNQLSTTPAPAPAPVSDTGGAADTNQASDGGGQTTTAPATSDDDQPILTAPTGKSLRYALLTSADIAGLSDASKAKVGFPIDAATLEAFAAMGFTESETQSASCEGSLTDDNGVPVTCTFVDHSGENVQAFAYGLDDSGNDAAGILLVIGEQLPQEIASRLDGASVYAYGQGSMFGVAEGIPASQVAEILSQTVANGISVGKDDDFAQGVTANCGADIGKALEDDANMVPCTVQAGDDTHHAVALAGDIINSGDRGLVVIIDD